MPGAVSLRPAAPGTGLRPAPGCPPRPGLAAVPGQRVL